MSNEEKMIAIMEWQTNPKVHPLTCGNNSKHAVLIPEIFGDDKHVGLKCIDCIYQQEWVPEVIYANSSRNTKMS